jgi:hypothetical protein
MKYNTEDNNPGKVNSRDQLSVVINHYLKGKRKKMFEFLGAGVGVQHYINTLEDLDCMYIVERNKKKLKLWLQKNKLTELGIPGACVSTDALEVFKSNVWCLNKFNVLNLDFCTFFYDNGTTNCTSGIIKEAFRLKAIESGGLMLLTFMITGIGVNLHKTALKNKDDIYSAIERIAKDNGYSTELVHAFAYKASKPTTMLNLALKCDVI